MRYLWFHLSDFYPLKFYLQSPLVEVDKSWKLNNEDDYFFRLQFPLPLRCAWVFNNTRVQPWHLHIYFTQVIASIVIIQILGSQVGFLSWWAFLFDTRGHCIGKRGPVPSQYIKLLCVQSNLAPVTPKPLTKKFCNFRSGI